MISNPLGRELFMAPEALSNESVVGFPNDIWSLGVILFILLVSYTETYVSMWLEMLTSLLRHIVYACFQYMINVKADYDFLLS